MDGGWKLMIEDYTEEYWTTHSFATDRPVQRAESGLRSPASRGSNRAPPAFGGRWGVCLDGMCGNDLHRPQENAVFQ
jgi:hypothetical protein